jgi:hypothetical protein
MKSIPISNFFVCRGVKLMLNLELCRFIAAAIHISSQLTPPCGDGFRTVSRRRHSQSRARPNERFYAYSARRRKSGMAGRSADHLAFMKNQARILAYDLGQA